MFMYVVGALIAIMAVFPVRADQPVQLEGKELVAELRKGGYVIFIRHPQTNPDQADTDPLNLENIKAQRQLSEDGRNQGKMLGQAFRTLKIPVDKVVSSKFHRAYETSTLLGIGEVITSPDVSEGGLVVSPLENERRAKALRQLLSTAPPAGKNTVVVSHKPNLQDAAGKEFGDAREGEAVVFKPLGGGSFTLAARVAPPSKWMDLAK